MWEENRKIINIVNKKTFQPRLKTGKKKSKVCNKKKDFG